MQEFNYNDRLSEKVGLTAIRRTKNERSDLIETFKIVTETTILILDYFQLDEGDRREHDQKLSKKRLRLNVRKYAFSNRVIDTVIGICCLPVALA